MITRILILIMALLPLATSAAAQLTANTGNLPVAIVMVDELPFAQARAVLIRRKEMKPQNIILVTRQTSPGDLTRAMSTLAASRRKKGDRVLTDMVAPIAENKSASKTADFAQAQKDLAELRTTRPRFMEGIGSQPALFSHLKPARAKR